jgi:hypothetical protein
MFLCAFQRLLENRIGGVIVSVLATGAVDRGYEPRSDQTNGHPLLFTDVMIILSIPFHPTRTRYPDSESKNICSSTLMLRA